MNNLELRKLEESTSYVKQNLKSVQDKDGNLTHSGTSQLADIVTISLGIFPQNVIFFNKINERLSSNYLIDGKEALSVLDYVLNLIKIEMRFRNHSANRDIFESARDKLDQALTSFKSDDYPSVLNNLNTSLELTLKDALDIPSTIPQINLGRIIDLLTSRKEGPVEYLKEAKRLISLLDNKTKHQGFIPSKVDCINAVKALEDLNTKLRETKIQVSNELRQEIYKVL